MTSNNMADLPPELTRSGRLDNKWFFDFPNEDDRKEIFKIHFAKTGREIKDNLLKYAANITEHFTGAEIEGSVNNIIKNAFYRMKDNNGNGEITKEDIEIGISQINTVYSTSGSEIRNLIAYVNKNKIPSTSEITFPESIKPKTTSLIKDKIVDNAVNTSNTEDEVSLQDLIFGTKTAK